MTNFANSKITNPESKIIRKQRKNLEFSFIFRSSGSGLKTGLPVQEEGQTEKINVNFSAFGILIFRGSHALLLYYCVWSFRFNIPKNIGTLPGHLTEISCGLRLHLNSGNYVSG